MVNGEKYQYQLSKVNGKRLRMAFEPELTYTPNLEYSSKICTRLENDELLRIVVQSSSNESPKIFVGIDKGGD